MLEVKVDTAALNRLNGASNRIERALEDGLDRAADVVLNAKVRQIQQGTYSRPIPRRKKSGQPAWTRSGAWMQGQRVRRTGRLERMIVTEGPAEKYEERLAHLPDSPIDGVNRSNPAAEETARIVEGQVVAVIEQALENALRGL